MIRVFISFASANEDLARALHAALTRSGATVFQFQQSARAGQDAWKQVYDSIQNADYFICLLSRDALKSSPVKKEIRYADYCNTNNDERPELVPVLLEDLDPAKWPQSLRTLTPLDLSDCRSASQYASGARKVVEALDIEEDAGDPDVPAETGRGGGEPDAPAGQALALRLTGAPETSEAPSNVQWTAEVENLTADDIDALRVTLDGREVADPFPIAAGETRQFVRSSRYKAAGEKTRRLRAYALEGQGAHLLAERDARVDVIRPKKRTAASGSGAEVEPSDAEARAQIDAGVGFIPWEAMGVALMVLVLGAAASWGALLAASFALGMAEDFVRDYPLDSYPALPLDILHWIGTHEWFHWISGLLVAGVILSTSWTIAEDEIPIGLGEYLWVAIKSALWAFAVTTIWAAAHVFGYSQNFLVAAVAAAVALSSVTLAFYALLDDI